MSAVKDFFVKYYMIYSDFIHSIFPDELGDFAVFIINIAVIILVIKALSSFAFDKEK